MGFRTSLYRVSIETVDKYRNVTQEEFDKNYDEIYDNFHKECIKSDTLTDIICEDTDGELSTKLFTNKLEIEDDLLFATVNKEQFLKIIEKVRLKIIDWFDGRKVDVDKDGNYKLGKSWKEKYMSNFTPEKCLQANQGEWNRKGDKWQYKWHNEDNTDGYLTINLDMNNKWIISDDWSYEYCIFDLIHILKIFDWDKSVIVAIGG